MKQKELIPIQGFLHRIFAVESFIIDEIVAKNTFKPRKDCEEYYLNEPIDWEAKHKLQDRNWRMQLQGWFFLNPIMNGFDSYPDKKELVDFFLRFAKSWWATYGQDPNDIVTNRMPTSYAWYDMSVGSRAMIIGFFKNRIDYYELDLTQTDKLFIQSLAEKHIIHLSNSSVFSLNNHGIFQAHGLMLLANSFEYNRKICDYASNLVLRLINSQFDENGIHIEHSPHYHFYALSSFISLKRSGLYNNLSPLIQKIFLAEEQCKWLVDPLKRPICIGDSILTTQNRIVFPDSEDGNFIISHFASSGYASVRSGWSTTADKSSMIFLMGGYHTKSHKHRDCLSFDWFENGQRIIVDSGKYGYKSDKYRNYFLSYRAHNTVEIEGFDILKIKPYGSILENPCEIKPGIFLLQGKLDYPAIKHHRCLFYKPGEWVIVKDNLDFVRQRNFCQWWHLEKDFNLVSSQNGSILFNRGKEEIIFECLDKELETRLHFGDETNMQGFVSQKDFLFESGYAIGFSGNTNKKQITTIIARGKIAVNSAKNFLKIENQESFKFDISVIKNVANSIFYNLEDITVCKLELSGTIQVKVDNVLLTSYGHLSAKKQKRIIFCFPGATNRNKGLYDIQRFTWANDFKQSEVFFFSDPSYKPDNDLSLGWFQHNEESCGLDAVEKFIRHIASIKGYKENEIVFFGSSAGGFVSLKMAERFEQARCICINPQIYLYNYTQTFYNKMLEVCYPNNTDKYVREHYHSRIVVEKNLLEHQGKIVIFQNTYDIAHSTKHIGQYIENHNINKQYDLNSWQEEKVKDNLQIVYYDDEANGHSPPNREKTIALIQQVLE